MSRRPLTDGQVAVLAAVERLGAPNMLDLYAEFPALAPSALLRVLDALSARGLVQATGDPERVYLGGMTIRATGG